MNINQSYHFTHTDFKKYKNRLAKLPVDKKRFRMILENGDWLYHELYCDFRKISTRIRIKGKNHQFMKDDLIVDIYEDNTNIHDKENTEAYRYSFVAPNISHLQYVFNQPLAITLCPPVNLELIANTLLSCISNDDSELSMKFINKVENGIDLIKNPTPKQKRLHHMKWII